VAEDAPTREEYEALLRENAALKKRLAEMEALVRDLRALLQTSSRHSSMPPSSDLPGVLRPRRVPTGRSPGGQPGHPGKTRRRYEPHEVDHRVPVVPPRCGKCMHRLGEKDLVGTPLQHQVVEAPPMVVEVIEYLLHLAKCPDCGELTRAELPAGVPAGLVGPRLQAIYAFLCGRGRVSRREAPEIVEALLGPKAVVALGTVAAMELQTSEALAVAYEEAKEAVREAPFVNADETSWKEARDKAWLWIATTDLLKVFRIDRNRSKEAFERLLPGFKGILGTDRWSAYRGHPKRKRQLCWSHLDRNFAGLEELGGEAKRLGVEGQKGAEALFHWWHRFRRGEIDRPRLRREMAPIRRRFRWLLGLHEKNPVRKARAMCADLIKYFEGMWTFARVPGVEPTNNLGERDIRKAVLWRKCSFGSASEAGSRFVERMLTVCGSLRAQERPILEYLEASIRAHLVGSPHPSLLPVHAG
jgi:transposase